MNRHFGVKQLKIGKTMGVLHSFAWYYAKYANMEGFAETVINNIISVQLSVYK